MAGRRRMVAFAAFVASLLPSIVVIANVESPRTNLALHRPYHWSRPPDYAPTTDHGDAEQLTDGVYSAVTPLWKDKAAVGWGLAANKSVSITLDLGEVRPFEEV